MAIANFLARQLRKPSGWWGKFIMSRLLNVGNVAMNELTFQQLNLSTDKTVKATENILEVGFGGGYLLAKILDNPSVRSVSGVDFSPEIVEFCQQRFHAFIVTGKLELKCSSINKLPYLNASFTKICTVNTIYFWPDIKKALTELNRVLVPEGTLFICFNSSTFLEEQGLTKRGFQAYEIDRIKNLLETFHFKNLNCICQRDRDREEFICISAQKQ